MQQKGLKTGSLKTIGSKHVPKHKQVISLFFDPQWHDF